MNKAVFIIHSLFSAVALIVFLGLWVLSTSFNGPYEGGLRGLLVLGIFLVHFALTGYVIARTLGKDIK